MDPPKPLPDQNDPSTSLAAPPNALTEEHLIKDEYGVNGEKTVFLQASYQGNDPNQSNSHANTFPASETVNDYTASSPNESGNTAAQVQNNATNFATNQQFDVDSSNAILDTIQPPNVFAQNHPSQDSAVAGDSNLGPARSPSKALNLETGNIQALLDNLIASASSAPATGSNPPISASTTTAAPHLPSPAESQTPISALPTVGLPARPPPQDEPSMHPNYAAGQNIRSYHLPPPSNAAQAAGGQNQTALQTPPNVIGSNGLQPPPLASFQQPEDPVQTTHDGQAMLQNDSPNVTRPPGSPSEAQAVQSDSDHDQAYQDFLRAEASYVAEGTWDRFPQGSRLFVGNLFTEKVSKRMIWDIFSQYGALAQISMKNAYGFVQFVDPGSSSQAMIQEEGTELGGRKIRESIWLLPTHEALTMARS